MLMIALALIISHQSMQSRQRRRATGLDGALAYATVPIED